MKQNYYFLPSVRESQNLFVHNIGHVAIAFFFGLGLEDWKAVLKSGIHFEVNRGELCTARGWSLSHQYESWLTDLGTCLTRAASFSNQCESFLTGNLNKRFTTHKYTQKPFETHWNFEHIHIWSTHTWIHYRNAASMAQSHGNWCWQPRLIIRKWRKRSACMTVCRKYAVGNLRQSGWKLGHYCDPAKQVGSVW